MSQFPHSRTKVHLSLGGLILSALCLTMGQLAAEDVEVSIEIPPHPTAWQKASRFLTREAHEDFNRSLQQGEGDERENRLGVAVTRLGLQPRTQRNINLATEELRALIAENPGDEVGLTAKFYLARVHEIHQNSPDLEVARQLYAEVQQARSGNPLLEQSAARIALIDLYDSADDPHALQETALRLQELEEYLVTPGGRREFHTMIGNVLNDLRGDKATALRHMLKATAIPSPLPQVQSTNLLITAELAKELGDLRTAREFYTRFVEEFERDNRNYSVRRILEELPEGSNATDS